MKRILALILILTSISTLVYVTACSKTTDVTMVTLDKASVTKAAEDLHSFTGFVQTVSYSDFIVEETTSTIVEEPVKDMTAYTDENGLPRFKCVIGTKKVDLSLLELNALGGPSIEVAAIENIMYNVSHEMLGTVRVVDQYVVAIEDKPDKLHKADIGWWHSILDKMFINYFTTHTNQVVIQQMFDFYTAYKLNGQFDFEYGVTPADHFLRTIFIYGTAYNQPIVKTTQTDAIDTLRDEFIKHLEN